MNNLVLQREALQAEVDRLMTPPRPDWIEYSTDPEKLKDDPTGETYHTFVARLNNKLSPRDLKDIEVAYQHSKYGHKEQGRGDGKRFFNHPRATTLILIDELRILKKKVLIATLIHDIQEDTRLLDPENVKRMFGIRCMRVVNYLTKNERTKDYYFKILLSSEDWYVFLIKCCDRLHNMRTLHFMSHEKVPIQLKETRSEFPAIFEALEKYAPPKHKWVAGYLEMKIFEVCDAQERLWQFNEAHPSRKRA